MPRLICVFAGRTLILLVLSCRGSGLLVMWFLSQQEEGGEGLKEIAEVDENQQEATPREDSGEEKKDKEKEGEEEQTEKETARAGENEKGILL